MLLALAPLLLAAGCGPASSTGIKAALDRQSLSDADLRPLLPRGLDAVVDVDVAALRAHPRGAELASRLPGLALSRLRVLTDEPLRHIDALCAGGVNLGTEQGDWVLVARGETLERDAVFARVRAYRPEPEPGQDPKAPPPGPLREVEYHGLPLLEPEPEPEPEPAAGAPGSAARTPAGGPRIAVAALTAHTFVAGSRVRVRQIIDVYRGEEAGAFAPVGGQPELQAALRRAPRTPQGRPAVLFAMLFPPAVRAQQQKLSAATGAAELATETDFLAGALALGDGMDLGAVAGFARLDVAEDVRRRILDRVALVRERPALVFLGVPKLLEPLILVAVAADPRRQRPTPELHLGYRLADADYAELLRRAAQLGALTQGGAPPLPGPSRPRRTETPKPEEQDGPDSPGGPESPRAP